MKASIIKTDKKVIKRKKIIESASILFSQKNYHEVMMEDVAKLASLAKGTVYNYFESKEHLYFSIMLNRMEHLINSLREKIQAEIYTVEALRSFVIHLYMFMMKYQNFFLMYRKESFNTNSEICSDLIKLEDELNNMLNEIIIKGKKEKLFREIGENFAVQIILGCVYSAVKCGIEKNYSESDMIEEREKLFEFVLHGIFDGFKNDKLPLLDKKIVITRTSEQSNESARVFRYLGASVLIFPTLDIIPPASWKKFDQAIKGDEKIDYIIFTSVHAVKMFKKRIDELKLELDYNKIKIVAVGNKTSNVCKKNNIPVHIIPETFSGDGVVKALSEYDLNKKLIFIPRSAIGRDDLPKGLGELGAQLKTAPVYNISIPTEDVIKNNIEKLKRNKPDLFIFTSPSTFNNFLQIMKIEDPALYFKNFVVAAIGPTTKREIESKRVKVDVMPSEYTIEGLASAIINFYNK